MSVAILLVTHTQLGEQLLAIANTILCQPTSPLARVSVPASISAGQRGRYADQIDAAMRGRDDGAGAAALTDIHGATPDNLARHCSTEGNARIASGVNLPMMLPVLNYRRQPLQQKREFASRGGRSGIKLYENRPGYL